MSAAEKIRRLAAERCSVSEIAASIGVSRCYVRHVLRRWGYLAPTAATYPDTPAQLRHARAAQ